MPNIISTTGTVKVFRDRQWVDVTSTPFEVVNGDIVKCFNGGICTLDATAKVRLREGDTENGSAGSCLVLDIGAESYYYYPRQ